MEKFRLLTILCLFSLSLIILTNQAQADEWEILEGTEFTSEGESVQYLGVGLIRPLSGNYWILGRLMGLHVDYKFEVDEDTLDGQLSSINPSLGVRYAIKGGSLSLFGGVDIEWIEQERQNEADAKDQKTGVSAQGELDKWWSGAKNLSCILNYKSVDSFFWGRLRGKKGVGRLNGGDIFLGLEGVGMGNADFAAYQAGALTEVANIISNLSVGLKAGYKHSSSFTDSIYGGVEFYYHY